MAAPVHIVSGIIHTVIYFVPTYQFIVGRILICPLLLRGLSNALVLIARYERIRFIINLINTCGELNLMKQNGNNIKPVTDWLLI